MLEPMMPEYSKQMYLQGFSAQQIMSAFRQTKRREQKRKRDKEREQSILEKEMYAFIEKVASAALNEALNDITKEWNK